MMSSQALSQSVSQSQSRQNSSIVDPVEREKRVNELVQYLLVNDQKKIPIKKKDINRVVLKGMNKSFAPVMEEASRKLLEVYGFKVVELQGKMKDSFILINDLVLSESQQKFIQVSEKEAAEMGLVTIILGIIFMNGNVVSEDEMWHALKKVGIIESEIHSTFGNVRNLIMMEFVRRGYLSTELDSSTDPPRRNLYWGQRAQHEISLKNMLAIVCDIYETQPGDWIHQMEQVAQQEVELAQGLDGTPGGPSSSSS